MRDLLSWNVSLGRWADVNVRLHVSFLVLLTAVVHLGTAATPEGSAVPALVGLLVLFLSVVGHELGHCIAAWKAGGRVERIVLGPWGGLTYVCPTREPQTELLTTAAGPAVNFAVTVVCTVGLAACGQPITQLLYPFEMPPLARESSVAGTAALAAWINWLIVLVNLLPAYPLDGARALRAIVRPHSGFRSAVVLTGRTGFMTSLAMFLLAFVLYDPYQQASLACSLLGIFLYFSSWQEAERLHDGDVGDDADVFDERIDSAEEDQPRPTTLGPVQRWLRKRRQQQTALRLQKEREEEQRVDDVLARLHTLGPQALSSDDRALLERVSARFRRRQGVDEHS